MAPDEHVMGLLAAGIPVSLLIDLVELPDADEVYLAEGGVADWLTTVGKGAA